MTKANQNFPVVLKLKNGDYVSKCGEVLSKWSDVQELGLSDEFLVRDNFELATAKRRMRQDGFGKVAIESDWQVS